MIKYIKASSTLLFKCGPTITDTVYFVKHLLFLLLKVEEDKSVDIDRHWDAEECPDDGDVG